MTNGWPLQEAAHWKSPTLKLFVRPAIVSLNVSTEKFVVTGYDKPEDKLLNSNIYCYRPNMELYAILSRKHWMRLRRLGELEQYLSERRDNKRVNSLDIDNVVESRKAA